jgi:hypothetical protein
LERAGIDRNATRADNFGKDFAVHMPWHIGAAKGYPPALPVFNRCMRFFIDSEVFEIAKPLFSILAPYPDYVEQTIIGICGGRQAETRPNQSNIGNFQKQELTTNIFII